MSIAVDVNRDIPSRQSEQEVNLAEDEGFEPSIGCPIHAFQACALGRYANPPEEVNSIGGCNYDYARSLVRRYRTELPQGRNAARVGPLWRVCEGSF